MAFLSIDACLSSKPSSSELMLSGLSPEACAFVAEGAQGRAT